MAISSWAQENAVASAAVIARRTGRCPGRDRSGQQCLAGSYCNNWLEVSKVTRAIWAKTDLKPTVIRKASADGWVTNLTVYAVNLLPAVPQPSPREKELLRAGLYGCYRSRLKACVRDIVPNHAAWAATGH
ncbi:hypothetical protein KCP73_15175 [Salmonella enterica subsp. enterica]|nr:hypothetical protein KCP73_15175 [Salmonella enterica subsp. enterica]